jgi:hypothetical protein
VQVYICDLNPLVVKPNYDTLNVVQTFHIHSFKVILTSNFYIFPKHVKKKTIKQPCSLSVTSYHINCHNQADILSINLLRKIDIRSHKPLFMRQNIKLPIKICKSRCRGNLTRYFNKVNDPQSSSNPSCLLFQLCIKVSEFCVNNSV